MSYDEDEVNMQTAQIVDMFESCEEELAALADQVGLLKKAASGSKKQKLMANSITHDLKQVKNNKELIIFELNQLSSDTDYMRQDRRAFRKLGTHHKAYRRHVPITS